MSIDVVERSSSELVDRLIGEAVADDRDAIVFENRRRDPEPWSKRRLRSEAMGFAAALRAVADPGDRAIIVLPTGPDYVVALLGCLISGVIAVPATAMPAARRKSEGERLAAIAQDCAPSVVIAGEEALSLANGCDAVLLDPKTRRAGLVPGPRAAEEIAFLQYTSGSTATPKGVMVSLGNVCANLDAFIDTLAMSRADTIVSWLPLFHDMGLISGLLLPLYVGCRLVLTSPIEFAERPRRWLELITRYRGTISLAPNFAYQLCMERIGDDQLEGLDLASMRAMVSGAEPIRSALMQRFFRRFAAVGLAESAGQNGYGLAEATLLVSATPLREAPGSRCFDAAGLADGKAIPDESGTSIADCGRAALGFDIAIVDLSESRPLPPDTIGEIWVAGPSVTSGYWQKPEVSATTMHARLPDDARHWLRTGDLGFVHDGSLFVTGRCKDLIILRGQNIAPQDIEDCVENSVPGLRPGRIAAFPVAGENGESIGIAAECARGQTGGHDVILKALRAAVAEAFDEAPSLVLLLRSGDLPRTTSGKLRRSACLDLWQKKSIEPVAFFAEVAASETTHDVAPDVARIIALWRDLLGRTPGPDDDFVMLGGDSLKGAALAARIESELGWLPPPGFVFEARTPAAQARALAQRPQDVAAQEPPAPDALSVLQEALWTEHRLDPENVANNIAGVLRLRDRPDISALRTALTALARRHQALHSVIVPRDDRPIWQPLPEAVLDFAVHEDDGDGALRDTLARPFDLAAAPPFRACLVRTAGGAFWLQLVFHHIAADGIVAPVLVEELGRLYEAAVADTPVSLPAPPTRPADPPILDADLAYWRETLAGLPARLELATDRTRTTPHDGAFWRVERTLPQATHAALTKMAAGAGITTAATHLALFSALLHRMSGGTQDMAIGVPVSLRPQRAMGWAGHCMNAVPLRLAPRAASSLGSLTSQAATALAAAITHAQLPFPTLVDALRPPRDALTPPFFRAMFNHRRDTACEARFGGLATGPLEDMAAAAPFDVTLEVMEQANGTRIALDLARDQFERETAERLIEDYLRLAERLAAGDDAALGTLLAPQAAAPPALPPLGPTAEEAIRRVAAEDPSRDALRCGAETLTYGALDALADATGAALRATPEWQASSGRERIVGLAISRGVALPAAMLGIWRAGATLLPIEPETPAARIAFMLRDCGATLLVTDDAGLAAQSPAPTLAPPTAPTDRRGTRDASDPHPQSLAYVLYTSGSTGEPKGVAITHEALARHLGDFRATHRISRDDVVLQSSTVGFDVFLHELFPALMTGGRVVMRGAAPWSFNSLNEALHSGVTFARIPTSFWRQWLPHAPAALPALRQVTVGGEALPGDALAAWHAGGLRDVALDNLYGPTETTVACLHHAVARADADAAIVSIGHPYPSRTASIRDTGGNPVLRLGVGELCIGGPTVARGYCGRPGLTAERFVPDPDGAPGARLYRTGDLARWRADGSVDFLGRVDSQIKLRGIRIEPAEIEAALRGIDGVDDAVVLLRDVGPSPTLVGYVAGRADVEALHQHLAARLPAAMVPSRFVVLDSFPLLASGKVDRAALPPPPETAIDHAVPGTPVEQVLHAIWCEVLGVADVGTTEDFFALGGDSILSLRVVARAREHGLALSPRQVFEAPTIAGLARLAQPLASAEATDPSPRPGDDRHVGTLAAHGIAPDRVEAVLPVTPLQRGLLLLSTQSAEDPYHAQHVFSIEGLDDPATLRDAWVAATARHAMLRTGFVWRDSDEPTMVVHRAAVPRLTERDWRHLDDDASAAALAADWAAAKARGFDFAAAGPDLLLIRRGDTRYWLVWRMHHAQIDGWSLALVLDEVARGEASRRPTTPFARYVDWRAARDTAPRLSAWRDRLAAIDGPTPLPRARPAAAASPFAEQVLDLDTAADRRLSEAARRLGVTRSTLVQAAWAWLLSRHADAGRVVFGVTVSGRPETLADVERIVGLFINTMPLVVALDPARSVSAWLAAIQADTIDLWDDADLPAHDLQAQSALPAGAALFESIVVFENYPIGQALRGGHAGVTLQHITPDRGADGVRPHRGRNHYPLSLVVQPSELQGGRDGLQFALSYATERFDHATAARLLQQFGAILTHLCEARPQDALQSLSPAPEAIGATPNEAFSASLDALLAEIARRAEAEPDGIALTSGDDALGWTALWDLAERRAAQLAALGVRTETPVAICLPRGLDYVAWMIAVWRAGGMVVPLDPAHPPARLSDLLRRSGSRILVAEAGDWPDGVTRLDRASMGADVPPPGATRHPAQAAYVIHTSGSTGVPKGVVVSDASISAYLDGLAPLVPAGFARAAWVSSPAADLGFTVLLGALRYGWTLHIPDEDDLFDPDRFAVSMQRGAVDLLKITPSHMRAVLETADALPARCLILGGEETPPALLARVARLRPDCVILNHYGPTETSVGILAGRVAALDAAPPLGRPLAQAQVMLRASDGSGVALGQPGEICCAGPQVARGYLGSPGATAERFLPSEIGPPGSRVYRTGDRGIVEPDGTVRFLGRVDAQVKVNGVRVEPSEVEACLSDLPGVIRGVVLARPDEDGRNRLVAWVSGDADPAALRVELAQRLPGALVPTAIVRVESFPLTANGKLDRARLPDPAAAGATAPSAARPVSAAEATIRAAWQAVLKREAIGLDEDFFALGGDSIASLQIISRVRESGLHIAPRDVFAHPTIAGLAAIARSGRAVSRRHVVTDVDLPLTPIQTRFFQRHPDGESHWNQAVVLRAPGLLDETVLRDTLIALVTRHDALRLRFHRHGDAWHQRVPAEAGAVALRMADLRDEPDAMAAFARLQDECQRAMDISRGPLVSALHVRLPAGDGRLMLAIHHLAVDGVSWRVLIEELRAVVQGQALRAPDSTSWSRWTQHLAAYAADAIPHAEREWWQAMLAGADDSMPLAQATPDDTIGASREVVVRLDGDETERLLRRAAGAWHIRAEAVLIAALVQALSAWRGRAGALLEMEGHGREDVIADVDLSRTVGWFTTRYSLWLPLSAEAAAETALVTAKDALRAIPARGFNYGLLPLDGPRPHVSFNYLGRFEADDGDWAILRDSVGASSAPAARMVYGLDINAIVLGGALSVSWRYSPGRIAAAEVEALAADFAGRLRTLIDHCLAHPAPRSAGDFPLAGLDQAAFAALRLDLRQVADLYRATPLQAGLLMHAGEADGLPAAEGRQAYVNQLRATLPAEIEIGALRAAWRVVAARHDILRTAFVVRPDGPPLQCVGHAVDVPIVVLDWREAAGDYETRLADWRRADLVRGLDPAVAPLWRVALVRRPDSRLDMIWTHHHALTDGWSAARIFGELGLAYAASRDGRTPELPPVRPYRDYIAWLAAQTPDADWWRGYLDGIGDDAGLLEAVGRRGQADGPSFARESLTSVLPGLEAATRRRRITLSTLVQAAWALVLSRSAGRRRVAFGVTVAGRPPELAGASEMVGLFINSLPMRAEVKADARLDDWLDALKRVGAELGHHGHVPLAEVQRLAGQAGHALFDSLIVFENYPIDESADSALRPDAVEVDERTHYPLTLTVTPGAHARVHWAWDRDLVCAETVDRLRAAFSRALAWLSAEGETHVGALALPGATVAAPTAETAAPFTDVLTRIAACDRAATALVCGDEQVDYGTLLSRAWGLSHWLGHAPEERIGLCASRSSGLVAGLLGIMGASAAYVPLDPAYPRARLAHALNDAGITRVVVDAAGAAALGNLADGREIIRLDEIAGSDTPPSWPAPHPEQLAYVIYTSGSTGTPKGVGVSHGALVRLLEAMHALVPIAPSDRWLAVTSMSFDIAALELFLPLIEGAQVVLAREAEVLDGSALAGLLLSSDATVMQATPSGWKLLLASGWRAGEAPADGWPSLRGLSGGEALPADLAGALAARGVALWNVYGPTETTIWSSGGEVTPALLDGVASARLGAPLEGEHLTLLSEDGLAVPQGGAGELCIGGNGLARGYLGRPSLTAERFVPDAAGAPGSRLYRTGDLVRADAHGLAYLGRLDTQVKLRGHRIELGEIEAVLRGVPGVADAAVKLHGGGTRLVGYVTGDVEPEAVRVALGEKLPAIMVPQVVVVLDALPLTPNGKLDRNRLEEPATQAIGTAPRNEAETAIVRAVMEVVGLRTAYVEDNFFHLGGESISAMRVVMRLRELGWRVSTRQIFEAPALGALAGLAQPHIEEIVEPVGPRTDLAPGLDDLYPATSVQAGMLYHGLRAPGSGLYVGQLRLRLGAGLDADVLQRAFDLLIARHAILRTGFELRGDGGVLQVVRSTVDWRLDVVDAPADAAPYDAHLAAWCTVDRARGFDLAQAPLLRVGLLHRPDGGFDLVWTSHHALLDGWSQSRLLGELSLAYAALRAGGTPSLGPVRPYRDYIAWLGRRDEAASEAWWRAMFAGDEPALLLASLGDAGAAETAGPGSDRQVRETLDEATSTALRAAARRHGLTMGTLLQGAWALLLSRYGGKRRVAFGVTVSGRPAELEGVDAMLGLFINSLPFWVDVRGEDDLWSFLAGLQTQAGGLREHEHTPLPSLQRWSGRGSEGLFDSLIVFENYPVDSAAKGVAGDLAPRGAAVLERTHYPLTIMVDDGEDGLSLRWLWDGARLGEATAQALRRDYAAVLAWLAAVGATPVGALALPGATITAPTAEAAAPFTDVLTRIAARDRAATALVCGEERVDYGTLLSRAWGLSKRLGHAPEERIGLCAGRSTGLVAGLLGIMGAGAAYVPLDPAYPQARLAHALSDAGITRVVVDAAGADALGDLADGREIIRLDEIAGSDTPPSWPAPHPEQLAYVIYTSGSTGTPKGVGVSHGALVCLLEAMLALVPIAPSDRWLAVTSMSFDIAALELFLPLIKGAQVILAREVEVLDGSALAGLLLSSDATVMQATPSGWKLLLASGWRAGEAPADGWPSLRGLSGGEALPADLAGALAARGVALWNVYGPTETTIWSSGGEVTPALLDGVASARLGAPLEGEHLTLLSEDGLAVPQGGAGELCIGGNGLARGYLGRPSLTAERFVPDAGGAPGSRLYRTGDLVRADARGLAYLGRLDTQVKLRGHRIELGEIEAALRGVPGVADAAVKLHGGGTRLVGYVTGDVEPEAVRVALGEKLPAIMVPQVVVVLDALPLTPNGKLDRNRLEEPATQASGAAPRNETETAICAAFAEVLGLDRVYRDSLFFQLGGDSIGVMRLSALLSERLGTSVPVADVFRHPTPAALADLIAARGEPESLDDLLEGLV